MEKLKGVISKVDNTVIDYPGKNKYAAKKRVHVSYFQMNGRRIKFESVKQQKFHEGHQMIVAGVTQSGIFNALAYRDLTTGDAGSQGLLVWFFCGALFLATGIAILGIIDSGSTTGQIIGVGLFGSVFIAFSALYCLWATAL